ncbi:MAG: hypothetical protein EA356_10640 [Geminicoccaceae bacterium]|nr:MAG: hypothetical protein EA356_10640 [Geminicoccaceae bacterium]
MFRPRFVGAAVAALFLSLPAMPASASVVLFDGDFDRSDWDNIVMVVPIPGRDVADGIPAGVVVPPSFVTFDTPPDGGNPGAYRLHRLNWVRYGERVFGGGVYLGGTYDPATQGAIQSVDFSADAFVTIGNSFRQELTDWQVVVRQGGVEYYSVPMQRFVPAPVGIGDPTVFQPLSLTGLVASSFDTNPLAFFEGAPTGLRPDFSAWGEAIHFGYVFSNTRDTPDDPDSIGGSPIAPPPNDPVQFTYTAIPILDNWQVTAHVVPLPGALPLLATGMVALAWLRRRRDTG